MPSTGQIDSLDDSQRKETGKLERIMNARLNRQGDENSAKSHVVDRNRLRVNYQAARLEEDPFPDPSLLDPID